MSEEILRVNDLSVAFPTEDGMVNAVRGVSYHLNERDVLAIVGESGSGKSVVGDGAHGPAAEVRTDHR